MQVSAIKFTGIAEHSRKCQRKTPVKNERLCKARAEAKFTWIIPSRRQRCIYMNLIWTKKHCTVLKIIIRFALGAYWR